MADKIILKNSSEAGKVPQPADLDIGELAVNASDGKVFTKKSDGTVTELSGVSGSTTPPSGVGDFDDRNYSNQYTHPAEVVAEFTNVPFSSVATNKSGKWYAAANNMLAVSEDNGATWANAEDTGREVYLGYGTGAPSAIESNQIVSDGANNWLVNRENNTGSMVRNQDDTVWQGLTARNGLTTSDINTGLIHNDLWFQAGESGYATISTDGGDTWEKHPDRGLNTGYVAPEFQSCDINRTTNTIVVAAVSGYATRSTDNGVTWTGLPRGINSGNTTQTWNGIAVGKDNVWVAVGSSGYASRSTDDGLTWSALPVKLGTTASSFYNVATDGNGVWVALTNTSQISRSTDNGVTWTPVVIDYYMTTLKGVSTDGNGVWVAVSSAGYATRSTDNGATWSELPRGLGLTFMAAYTSFAKGKDNIVALYNYSLTDTAARTTDFINWTTFKMPFAGGLAIEGSNSGTFIAASIYTSAARSTDDGATWTPITIDIGTTGSIGIIRTDHNGTWIAAASSYASISYDDGVSWSPLPRGLNSGSTSDSIYCIGTDGNGVWMIGMDDGYISRSTDNGATWTVPNGFNPSVYNDTFYSVDTNGNGLWIATMKYKGVFYSTDNGENWSKYSNTPLNSDTAAFTNVLYLGDGKWISNYASSIYKTENDGVSWYRYSASYNTKQWSTGMPSVSTPASYRFVPIGDDKFIIPLVFQEGIWVKK